MITAPTSGVVTAATGERAHSKAPDEATRAMFGAFEVHTTPANAPAALFKIGEPVFLFGLNSAGGGTIEAVAWKKEYNSYAYKVNKPKPSCDLYEHAIRENDINCSLWTVGDVVWVEAFGKTSKRQIEKVHVSARGIFSYDIEGRFTVRHEDITGLVGRRR